MEVGFSSSEMLLTRSSDIEFSFSFRTFCKTQDWLHTYIHNWSLQPTTYVVCVTFIHKWRDLQFKADSERQIFEELPEICWKKVAEEIFVHISFCWRWLVWDFNLLKHSDFKLFMLKLCLKLLLANNLSVAYAYLNLVGLTS